MGRNPNTQLAIERETQARALARIADCQRRTERRAVRRISQFDNTTDDSNLINPETEIAIMTYSSEDAITASRRRIEAGIAAFERATAMTTTAALSGIERPDDLLDALGRSALANAAADLAALAGAAPTDDAAPTNDAVIDGGDLVAEPVPDSSAF